MLTGTAQDDLILGLGGSDVLNGGDGNDILVGGPNGDHHRYVCRQFWHGSYTNNNGR